ncbi:MBL fold metallo-hydrolase [Lagierella sp.]|uniref:MBL fold metallo-hydrolase n=1 Tax=Lagierella sp. TaxID=2849657 RepID=UPI0026198EA5|nr:MBL fold metallo-hydrolase [Lagierella sp.]
MKITSFGTTTLLFDDGNSQILFDAHFTRPSVRQYLFKRVSSDEEVIEGMLKKYNVNRLEGIFISHSHYDHVMDAPFLSKKTGATIYGSKTTKNIALGEKVNKNNIVVFKDYRVYEIGDFKITVIPSKHSKPRVFNNDLGEEIKRPLRRHRKLRNFKEGGSYDFYIENNDKSYLIHPSCNYIENRLKDFEVDVLFLALAGITKMDEKTKNEFFHETIGMTKAKLVLPIHWDNFFKPLDEPTKTMPRIAEKTDHVLFELVNYCEDHGVDTVLQLPRTSFHV